MANSMSTPCFIDARQVYPLREAARRLGWQQHAIRQAKRAGLRLLQHGRLKYVLGEDLLDFFRRQAEQHNLNNHNQ